jgi:integrase
MRVALKGIAKVKAKGRAYYYAWRGGPRLRGEPGTPEFVASYNEAIANLRTPDPDRFRSLVTLYRDSEDFRQLSASTKKEWLPWLDRIGHYFGELRIAQFDRPEKIRPVIRQWRNKYKATPRTADYALQVLSRVCAFAVEECKLSLNPCKGFARLYSVDRSGNIWTDADIAKLKATCSPEIAHAVDLAAHTGLRQGDLLRLSWSHIGENAIVIPTGKSGHRREAIIPLYDDLKAVLARIPKRATTVLTNSRGRPWKRFRSSFDKAKNAAGLGGIDLHFHDLRGTAATRFYAGAGLSVRVVAEIMAWEETNVEKIIRRYVDRTAATRAVIAQLNKRGT